MYTSDCTVIIRSYNEEKHIARLLSGIIQQTIKNVEIILVDSGSTDATLSIASQYPVKIISIKPEDFSFGYSLNIGCEAASANNIVIASGHVYPVYKDWIERLVAPFENEEIALVYGKQRGNETTNFSEHRVFAKWFPDQSDWDQRHPFCNNANAAIRYSLWRRFPYDESLTGLEDISWAKKVFGAGYKIAYEAGAEVIHVHNEPPQVLFNRYRREAIALKRIYPNERFNFWDFIRILLQNVISDYYHALNERVLGSNLHNIFIFRLMQFWGTYRGFSQRGVLSDQLRQRFYYPNPLPRKRKEMNQTTNHRPLVDYTSIGGGKKR